MKGCQLHLAWLLLCVAAAPASQPSGTTLSGNITVAGGGETPRMIVYLEAVEPSARFEVPAEAEISQKGAKFHPSPLVISVGQSVRFKNDEDRPIEHNVFSRSPTQQFDLGLYPPPQAKVVAFDKPGVVRLFCSIHKLMDGVIYVCPTPFWADVDKEGNYTISSVPAGEWRLKTWQLSARYAEQDVPVTTDAAPVVKNLEMSRK